MKRATGDYCVLFGRGKDILPYFARWQSTQITALLEGKSDETEYPIYGKLNVAGVNALIGSHAMPSCVTELNAAQIEGIVNEICQTQKNTESEIAAGNYHYLFGKRDDLLPCVAQLHTARVFIGKLNAVQADAVIENARQNFNEMVSAVEDNFIVFMGFDDHIPMTLVYLGKMTGAQQMVVFEEIHRATIEKIRSGLPYLMFMGMRLSWLIDFVDEISKSVQEQGVGGSPNSESNEYMVRQIHHFAKTVNLGSNPLLSNPQATFIRLKNFFHQQKLNPVQQVLYELYVNIAKRLVEDEGYGNVSALEPVEESPKMRRGDPTRDERIKAAYKAFFSAILVRKVTQEEIAREHGFTKETNILSKEYIRKKFNVQRIYDEIEEFTKLYKDIRNISDKDKAKLLAMIYDTLEG